MVSPLVRPLVPCLLAALCAAAAPRAHAADAATLLAPTPLGAEALRTERIHAQVRVALDGVDITLHLTIRNSGAAPVMGEVIVPHDPAFVPVAAGLDGRGLPARSLTRDEFRETARALLEETGDPGVLAFAGAAVVRVSEVALAPGARGVLTLRLEGPPPADGAFRLVRGVSVERRATPWTIDIHAGPGVVGVYSPTHALTRRDDHAWRVRADEPGCVELVGLLPGRSSEAEPAALGAAVLVEPRPDPATGEGGYFLLAAEPAPPGVLCGEPRLREVTLVIDRSASLRGDGLDRVKEAALGVVARLRPGEALNIIDFADEPRALWDQARPVDQQARLDASRHILGLAPGGGSDASAALEVALSRPPTPGAIPIVVLMTDGTGGARAQGRPGMLDLVRTANPHARRVFPVGLGEEVNAPLLDALAIATRGSTAYVLPGETLQGTLDRLMLRLDGPVLARPTLRVIRGSIDATEPALIPDLFAGERLVVAGRYTDDAPVELELAGELMGEPQRWRIAFDPTAEGHASPASARIWARRHVATLVENARDCGSGGPALQTVRALEAQTRCAQAVAQALVDLSVDFGVVTEHTAPLAVEGGDWDRAVEAVEQALFDRAVRTRRGVVGITHARNLECCRSSQHAGIVSSFASEDRGEVRVGSVLALGRGVVWRRVGSWGVRWVDASLLGRERDEPEEVVAFGSPAHLALADRLAEQGRASELALTGDLYLEVDGRRVLVRGRPGG